MRKKLFVLFLLMVLIGITPMVLAIGISPFDQHRPMIDRDGNKIFDDLEIEIRTTQGPYPVIVHLNETVTPALISYLQAEIGQFTPTYIYRYINSFATQLTGGQIQRLQNYPVIAKIQWDAPVILHMNTATEGFGATQGRRQFGVTGDRDGDSRVYTPGDVVIAMIDTGIDVRHYDLPPEKLLGWFDLLGGKTTPYDDNGHGTHVAGIAAGIGRANPDFTGVAPDAALVMFKAFDNLGRSRMSYADIGMEWVISQREALGIDILSISFGTRGAADGTDSTSRLVNYAVEKGIVVVIAAGNQGPDKETIGSPAAAEKGITVTGMADQGEGGKFLAYFTSRGPTLANGLKPDIAAPAWRISAPQANTRDQYTIYSGTSMAAPFTAGAIALLLDLNPTLTPAKVKDIILKSADDWGPDGWDPDYGMGKLNIENALRLVINPESILRVDQFHFRGEEDLSSDGFYDQWVINLVSVRQPLAITMVTELKEKDDDFNLYLYDPNGNLVAKGERGGRHEWISFVPRVSGSYQLEVVSYQGSGKYFLDLYGDIGYIYLNVDNRLLK